MAHVLRQHYTKKFRERILPACWFKRRLRAVRDRVLLVGADLMPQARRLRVRFAVPAEERPEFLHRLGTFSEGLPIAAQLEWNLREANDVDHASAHVPNAIVPTARPGPQRTRETP